MNIQIPVTVSVITYNSSRFVQETLESIKAQTYQPLILQICDDCSTDNTVRICRKWIEKNKDRFIETKIIISDHNTGVSANLNRAIDACKTEWFKGIAGDDILKPECIEENIEYVNRNPDAIIVFSRVEVFGKSKERCRVFNEWFDYSFFKLTPKEQFDKAISAGWPISSTTSFINVIQLRKLGIRADERIPCVDDDPFFYNLIKANVIFHFVDKVTVKYRVGEGGLSSGSSVSPKLLLSRRLYSLYYVFPTQYEINPENAINEIVEYESSLMHEIEAIHDSFSFRLGSFLLAPLRWVKMILNRQ